jgi:outer membrane lipoprotein SlyB
MRYLSCDLRVVVVLLGVALLVGCATDAPVRDERVVVKKDVPQQASKGITMGRVEAVREVTMVDKAQPYRQRAERNGAADSLAQTMIGTLSPKHTGLELLVRLDGGADMTVVQAADVAFRPGDRVRVMQGHDGATRVTY